MPREPRQPRGPHAPREPHKGWGPVRRQRDHQGGQRTGGRPARPARAARPRPESSQRDRSGQDRAISEPSKPGRRLRSLAEEVRATARPGQADRAVKAFDQAVRLLELGRDTAAVQAAREAKDLAPRAGAVREVLGMALYRAGEFREALRELQAYRRITGRADQNHLIADSHRALGAPEKAIEPVREALRSRVPEEARVEAAVVGAAALADLGRYAEALGMLKGFRPAGRGTRAWELRLWYVTGDVLQRAGRPHEAAQEFRRIVRNEPGAFDAAERLAQLDG